MAVKAIYRDCQSDESLNDESLIEAIVIRGIIKRYKQMTLICL